jgi:hypothetical protein
MELGDALVGDFLVDEDVRDDADDVAAGGECGVRDCAHQADARAPVDEAEAALRECAAELFSGGAVLRACAVCRRTEDGDAFAIVTGGLRYQRPHDRLM